MAFAILDVEGDAPRDRREIMITYKLALTVAVALAVAPPIPAQQHPHASGPMPQMAAMHCGAGMHGMMQGMRMDSTMSKNMHMMGPPAPGMILNHRQQLGLNADQVGRLEALQKQAATTCTEQMRLAMAAHRAANQLLESPAPDYAAYTAKLKEATAHMVEGQVAMAKAAVTARTVLTPEQQQTLKNLAGKVHRRP
jgi:Spy/CpxP family protein refolding chaperone